jgi:hypothetical protein
MENGMNDISATAELATAAKTEIKVTDDRGRILVVGKMSLLNYYMLSKAMGESANNPALMDMAVTAAAVRRINTTDFAMPTTETDVRFLMQQLDFDGLRAAGEGLRQLHAKADDGTDAAKNYHGNPPSV